MTATRKVSKKQKRKTGVIDSWVTKRGFGFLKDDQTGERIFIHIKSFGAMRNKITPVSGQAISYVVETDKQGRKRAGKSEVIVQTNHSKLGFISFFAMGLFGSMAFALTTPLTLIWYLLISSITYALYFFDKKASMQKESRIPEGMLQLLALFGGWPGALLAQTVISHKSHKRKFQRWFWVATTLNIIGLLLITTANYGGWPK